MSPEASPEAETDDQQPPAPKTGAGGCLPFVIAVVVLAVLEGVFVRIAEVDAKSIMMLGGIAGAGLMAVWTYYDAKDRQIGKAGWFAAGVFLVGMVVLPVYIFKTRGVDGFRLLLAVIGVFLLTTLIRMLIIGPAMVLAVAE